MKEINFYLRDSIARSNELKKRIILSKIATVNQIKGCSNEEISILERSCGLILPYSYKIFLKTFGRGAGRLMRDMDIFYDSVFKLTEEAREILSDTKDPVLPENAFVFTMRYGEQFFFFEINQGIDDPPIFYYLENATEFIKKFNSIWDFVEAEIELHEDFIAERQKYKKNNSFIKFAFSKTMKI
ncbi:MAG: SMI1/KNR4 family protein [Prochloraceae cyanobacterium]